MAVGKKEKFISASAPQDDVIIGKAFYSFIHFLQGTLGEKAFEIIHMGNLDKRKKNSKITKTKTKNNCQFLQVSICSLTGEFVGSCQILFCDLVSGCQHWNRSS